MKTETKAMLDTTIEPNDVDYSIRDVEPIEGYGGCIRFRVVGEFRGMRIERESLAHLKDGQSAKHTRAYHETCIAIRDDLQYKLNELAGWLSRRNPDALAYGSRDVAFPPFVRWTPSTPSADEDRDGLYRLDPATDDE